jgi:hypothetical protein
LNGRFNRALSLFLCLAHLHQGDGEARAFNRRHEIEQGSPRNLLIGQWDIIEGRNVCNRLPVFLTLFLLKRPNRVDPRGERRVDTEEKTRRDVWL